MTHLSHGAHPPLRTRRNLPFASTARRPGRRPVCTTAARMQRKPNGPIPRRNTMGLRVNNNIAALNAYRNLSVTDGQMSRS